MISKAEAIKLLICEKVCVEDVDGNIGGERVRQAYDMAIEALTSQNLTEPNNTCEVDLISRAEVHKTLSLLATEGGTDAKMLLADAHEFIDALPSADRQQGKWIKATGMMPPEFHGHHCCSECGNFANMEPPFGNREDLSEFCPNCGARMEVKTRGEKE